MGSHLTAVPKQTAPPKPKRERIELIETSPQHHWFVKIKDEQKRTIWYLRMQVTGQLARRYGPFGNKRQALLFLDAALNELADSQTEIESIAQSRILRPPFRHRWYPMVIEDELASQYRTDVNRSKAKAAT